MKLGFIFDCSFKRYENMYFSINLTQQLWEERYLPFCDEIVVVGREEIVQSIPDRMVRSDNDRVQFKCMPNSSKLKRYLNQKKYTQFVYDAVLDCDYIVTRGSRGAKIARMQGKPYLFEVVSCTWDSLWNHSFLGKLCAFPAFLRQKKEIAHAPYAMYVTSEFLQKRYPTSGKSIGCSDVALPSLDECVLKKRIDHIKQKTQKLIIGSAGAVNVKYKGQQFVIQALGELKKQGITNFEYQILGNGDQSFLKWVAQKYNVEDQVKLLGGMPHEKVFDWLDSIDVYAQPSQTEGLPRALVEAMSRGLPAFGCNVGGIPELLDNRFLFSKKQKIHGIKELLKSFDEKTMIKQAERNFEKAKEYQKESLDAKRTEFYRNFFTGSK